MRRAVGEGDTLVVEGELRSGSIQIVLRTTDDSEVVERRIDESGPFRVELPATEGLLDAVILSGAPRALQDDWSISRVAWRLARSAEAPRAVLRAPEVLEHYLPLNALERVGDWILFGRPIFTSLETFLAGHPKPMDRAVRSSPHNYYIDLTYNFGTLTLLPVIGLIVYTLRLAWQRRRDIWRSDRLAGITVLVLFLVLVDSNFKVTLRQPYPGIFAFFLWGLLLARLRTWNDPTAPPRGRARKPARPAPVPQAAP